MGYGETFKALSDPARRQILFMLRKGRMSAGEISRQFEMTQATVSYHLKMLKEADLVFEEKEKNFIYYTLNTSVVEECMLYLAQLKGEGNDEKIQ
ncbi:MAG: winged helix-turn-helix transcriptional regulator [Erysipelotrichaceae bacterium]|nr:winged helix-turn-helix transcriptional regulator [Erysipelotrichaceae bacterium]